MKYAFQEFNSEKMARALGVSLPISTKHSVEICKMIRLKNLQKAKAALEKVIAMDMPLRFTRFKHKVAHKKKIGAGRYPVKACREILKMLNSVEANAQVKNLDLNNLIIRHASANKAGNQFHYGRNRRLMKRTHLELVVEEVAKKSPEKQKKQTQKSAGNEK